MKYHLETARSLPFPLISDALVKDCAEAGIKLAELSIAHLPIDFDCDELTYTLLYQHSLFRKHGIKVVSVHIPFGREWDICDCRDDVRILAKKRVIDFVGCCAFMKPDRFIIHTSSEPIPDCERKTRINLFRANSAIVAKACFPSKLAVENLPRTCMGNASDELIEMTDGIDNICICCDLNHSLKEKTYELIENLGSRIETLHVSDYDGIDEKHWMPLEG
ncbi:MAG: TIM barrel protein, partial [Clostridiales bacterium]|nr:TIM barrel protein [Clostridiales bacterium]